MSPGSGSASPCASPWTRSAGSFSGTVSYVSSFVETRQEQNRTLTVEAVFDERELPPNLLPGLSADLEVILDGRDDVMRIPTYALLEGTACWW